MDRWMIFAAIVFLLFAGLKVRKFFRERRRHKKLLAVRDRKENIYLVACHPLTGDPPDVGRMKDYCEFVEHARMEETLKEWEEMLVVSGNRFWNDDQVRPVYKIQIILFFFRDGKFINEEFWEYGERVELDVETDRAVRHENLKKMNAGWYRFAQHNQNVVEWVK